MNEYPTILTRSGVYFNLLEPSPSMVSISDIAHALALTCRFAGHTTAFYSVAQHSVMASMIVPDEDALTALLHDGAEAYIGDCTRPLKRLLPDYKNIERRIHKAVMERFRLPEELPETVKRADLVMLATEQRDLMAPHVDEWGCLHGIQPLSHVIEPWDQRTAEIRFLVRYERLIRHKAIMAGADG